MTCLYITQMGTFELNRGGRILKNNDRDLAVIIIFLQFGKGERNSTAIVNNWASIFLVPNLSQPGDTPHIPGVWH